MSTDVREEIIARGWKQGALITAGINDEFKKLSHFDLADDDVFLVISQMCDLVNPSFDAEPFFEVLRLKKIDIDPGNEYLGGKNSRLIHFQDQSEGEMVTFSAVPFERFFVNRQLVLSLLPSGFLPYETCGMISLWLSRRYVRTAFPDSFDKRWKARIKQIEKIIKKLKLVKDIYIKIVPFDELDDAEEYDVDITLLMDHCNYNDPDVYAEYEVFRQNLEDQFSACEGITTQVIELRSDADITLLELEELSRWDYSYLSYREPDQHVESLSIL